METRFDIRPGRSDDALPLSQFAARLFAEAFGDSNRPENLAAYTAEAYGPEQQKSELADPAKEDGAMPPPLRTSAQRVQEYLSRTGIRLGKADGDYVKQQVGFAIGGIPPVGHLQPLETFLDRDLKTFTHIWAAAGTPFAVFELTPQLLGELTGGRWLDLAE